LLTLWILLLAVPLASAQEGPFRPDILLDDFERDSYAPWTVEGEAFGPGPAEGTLPHQMPVTGYYGRRLVNSFFRGDRSSGVLTSPVFRIERTYICFLIGGGGFPEETFIELLVEGQPVRRATGPNTTPGGSEELAWNTWNVREFFGKPASIRIVDRRSDFWGHINVDHIVQSDEDWSQQPPLLETPVRRKYFLLPVAEAGSLVHCRIKHGSRTIRYFDVRVAPSEAETLFWAPVDVGDYMGEALHWEIRPQAILRLIRSRLREGDTWPKPPNLYREEHRPQFHFSPRVGWANDPNGLVYFDGEYHLFFQHNPFGIEWGNMTWGHAVSRDLIHWEELGHALLPDERGTIFSGSTVVDFVNSSGLGEPGRPAICAFYTAAGSHSFEPRAFTQCLAYSLDRGRTWKKFAENPVVECIAGENRDPKVFWYDPLQHWVMVLYVRPDAFSLFFSKNLRVWYPLGEIRFPTAHECPELFELPVEGERGKTRWVLWTASGNHLIGQFDGRNFTPEGEVRRSEWGPNSYAGQTWNQVPDGRRILIAWMRSDGSAYRGMPFNQQMTIPRELSLRMTPAGLFLHAWPVRELEKLRKSHLLSVKGLQLAPGQEATWEGSELLDLEVLLGCPEAEQVTITVRGVPMHYWAKEAVFECRGHRVEGITPSQPFALRCLADRTSLEIFLQEGRYVQTFCLPFDPEERSVSIRSQGNSAEILSLDLYELRSIWEKE
jgi:fructan beta-fructosidase